MHQPDRTEVRSVLLVGAIAAVIGVAAVLRLWGLETVPPGLFCDEAGLGYNGYSIQQCGRDEEGNLFPLFIWSFGVSYKNPVFIYASTIPIGLFGLSEFSVRVTAALFGIAGVGGIAWVGCLLFGRLGGLMSALFLALCPWHLHFSRVAFELISLPALLLPAIGCFLAALRGRPRLLIPAGVLFSACLYAYAPAKLFVPLFLGGACTLYGRQLWRVRRTAVVGAFAALLTALPVMMFDLADRERAGVYFRNTTVLDAGVPLVENVTRVLRHYRQFFSLDFLFQNGDPNLRHAVGGFGELYWTMLPFLFLGFAWCLRRRNPAGKLLLWWLLLYPLAASLMNEVPSASRAFVGVAAFCLLAAAGFSFATDLTRRVTRGRRAGSFARDILLALTLAGLAGESVRYWRAYWNEYPIEAAEAFQHGYREVIELMEPLRSEYDVLLLTTTGGNQPQVFPLFYNRVDPERWLDGRNSGYLILDPAELDRYDPSRQRVLAAVRSHDLRLFAEYRERGRVYMPQGTLAFSIVEIAQRHDFVRQWLLAGPFDNRDGRALWTDTVLPPVTEHRSYAAASGPAYFRRVVPLFVDVDVVEFYARTLADIGHDGNYLCVYALTQIEVEETVRARLELSGSRQRAQAWLGGQPLSKVMMEFDAYPAVWTASLQRGNNELLLKLCRDEGEWRFSLKVTDPSGAKIPGMGFRARNSATMSPAGDVPPAVQMVNGFRHILRSPHALPVDGDYRGDSPGWKEHLYDGDGAVVWETDAVPRRAPTAFAFTASVSEMPGEAELWVDGRYALRFDTGRLTTARRWQEGAYVLDYSPQERGHNLSGHWVLQVPEEVVKPGDTVQLRVAHVDGSPHAFFMIKDRPDTAAFEGLAPGGDGSKRNVE